MSSKTKNDKSSVYTKAEPTSVQAREYNPNNGRAFNQFTSNHYDVCQYESELRLGSKPMKYYINQLNTPQTNPFMEFTAIGNQQVYNVQNEFSAPLPTRLNPLPDVYVLPYSTTPFLGQAAPSMLYSDTSSNLRFGTSNLRDKKSAVLLSEVDYNQWSPGVGEVVQNARQFDKNQGITKDGYYDYKAQNNVLFANGAWPVGGISSRNMLHNAIETMGPGGTAC